MRGFHRVHGHGLLLFAMLLIGLLAGMLWVLFRERRRVREAEKARQADLEWFSPKSTDAPD